MYASNASIKRGRAPWGRCVTSFVIIQGLAGLVYQPLSNMLYCGIVCEVSDKLECKRNSCSHSTTCNHIAIHNYRLLKPLCTEQLFLKARMTGTLGAAHIAATSFPSAANLLIVFTTVSSAPRFNVPGMPPGSTIAS